MTYLLLIWFFLSLFSIVFMLGRKLAVLEHSHILEHEEFLLELPYLKEVRSITTQNIKKHGYVVLVKTMRYYVLGTHLMKKKYEEAKANIKNRIYKNQTAKDNKEISKFLKIIGDYKHKIKEIKHRIKKEENL